MAPQGESRSYNYHRNVMHGNMVNKKGSTWMSNRVHQAKNPRRNNKTTEFSQHFQSKEFGDVVIKGGSPKRKKNMGARVTEQRYTLPDVLMNADIFLQQYERTHEQLHDALREIKTLFKIQHFNLDPAVEVLN